MRESGRGGGKGEEGEWRRMSVLIKGMGKPKNCYDCPLHYGHADCSYAEIRKHGSVLKTICPMVELPDHGDLIDRSMLIGGFADWYIQESPMYLGDSKVVAETIGDAMKAIEAAPVVIPAERSEE